MARITNGRGFTDQDLKKKDFVNAKGELDCARRSGARAIDALEGRLFDDGSPPSSAAPTGSAGAADPARSWLATDPIASHGPALTALLRGRFTGYIRFAG